MASCGAVGCALLIILILWLLAAALILFGLSKRGPYILGAVGGVALAALVTLILLLLPRGGKVAAPSAQPTEQLEDFFWIRLGVGIGAGVSGLLVLGALFVDRVLHPVHAKALKLVY